MTKNPKDVLLVINFIASEVFLKMQNLITWKEKLHKFSKSMIKNDPFLGTRTKNQLFIARLRRNQADRRRRLRAGAAVRAQAIKYAHTYAFKLH